jgi:hypothetical protein
MLKKPSTPSREQLYGWGAGVPFELPQRFPVKRNDRERQRPMFIELLDLDNTIGMPNQFYRRADTMPNLQFYWTASEGSVTVVLPIHV